MAEPAITLWPHDRAKASLCQSVFCDRGMRDPSNGHNVMAGRRVHHLAVVMCKSQQSAQTLARVQMQRRRGRPPARHSGGARVAVAFPYARAASERGQNWHAIRTRIEHSIAEQGIRAL